jgi:cysteinyl-tRNA synthetase
MLTANGQKMSKSLGNSFLPGELFSGDHPLLEKGFGPMTVRFFMLQSHYSSTLDFSNDALSAAEKGYKKLAHALTSIKKLSHPGKVAPEAELDSTLDNLIDELYRQMSDDFNSATTLATLFEMAARVNDFKTGNVPLMRVSQETFERFKQA